MDTIKEKELYILDHLSDKDLLMQLAEECNELSQAALKYIRAMPGSNNPTPKTLDECRKNFIEELADVNVCTMLLDIPFNHFPGVTEVENSKINRMYERIKAREYEQMSMF